MNGKKHHFEQVHNAMPAFNKLEAFVERLRYNSSTRTRKGDKRLGRDCSLSNPASSPFFVCAQYGRLTSVRACTFRVLNNLLAQNKAVTKYIEIIMIHCKICL